MKCDTQITTRKNKRKNKKKNLEDITKLLLQ
jgi:hypothetical protein